MSFNDQWEVWIKKSPYGKGYRPIAEHFYNEGIKDLAEEIHHRELEAAIEKLLVQNIGGTSSDC